MAGKKEVGLTKTGLLIKGLLNLFLFGPFLLILPIRYFSSLDFCFYSVTWLRLVGLLATLLGIAYTRAALAFPKVSIVTKITYLDAMLYPGVVLLVELFIKELPWPVLASALPVGVAAMILALSRGYKQIFRS